MVAIITAKGAGIENSSVSVLGGSGQFGSAELGRSGESVYVNAATGNLTLTTVDEMLVGRGPDAVASRTYNSLGAWDGDNGDDWRASVYRRVYNLPVSYGAAGSTVTRTDWDGSETIYTWNASYTDGTITGAYVSTEGEGAYDILARSGATWTWTDGSSRVTETYDENNAGRITGKSDTSGNSLSYTYTGNLLTQVTSANGEYTLLVYGGTGGTQLQYLETHTTTPTATTTRTYYEYDASDRLIQVKVNLAPSDNSKTVGTNYTTTYTYDGTSQRIASITQSDGTYVTFAYTQVGGAYRVTGITQTVATGVTRATTISYDTTNRVTAVTDALGQVTTLTYDVDGKLLSMTLPPSGTNDAAPAMSFTYEADGDVAMTSAAGNAIAYAYDSHGNRTLERDSLGNSVVRSFSGKNVVLTETRYTVPDPDGAGSGSPSGAMTTRYAYDSANRLKFVVDGEGLVTQYFHDSYGQQTATMVYAGNSYSLAGLGDTTSIAESALNSWVTSANKTTAQRTETSYDFRGNIYQVTSYAKLLSTGAFDTTSERSQTTYVYSSHGELLSKQVDGRGLTQVFVYDGLSRIISSSEVSESANLMDDASNPSQWSPVNSTSLGASGTLAGKPAISVSASAAGVTGAIFSDLAPVVSGDKITYTLILGAGTSTSATVAITGTTSWMGNAADATAVIVSGPGALAQGSGTSFQVTGLGAAPTVVSITRTFTSSENARAVVYVGSGASVSTGSSILFADPVMTRRLTVATPTVHTDATNSTVAVTLANGLVQTSTYDRAGNLITYAESGAGVTPATASYKYDLLGRLRIAVDPIGQRNFFYFYDADGRKVADIDGDGSATEYRYDAAGRLTSRTAYATRLTSAQLASLYDAGGNPTSVAFPTIRPATDSTNDRWRWTFYDLAGRAIRTIDGTGAATVLAYDGASQLVSATDMANRISSSDIAALKSATLGANLFTNATAAGFWSLGNVTQTSATAIDGINAYTETATTATLANIQSWGQQQSVSAGDTLSFTITLKAGSVAGAIVNIRGSATTFGGSSEATYTIVSGPGTMTGQSGAYFTFSGLSTSTPTVIKITRTFTQSETASAGVYIGTNPGAVAAGDSIIVSNPIFARAAASLPALPAADSANDRVVRNFYDNAGRLVGSLDAEGYVSKIEYDKAGRRVHTIARKTKPSTTTGSFATIFASATADNAKDIHNWWVYDARGLLRATIDAEGTVTRMDYTAAGDLSQQTSGQLIAAATLTTYMTTPPTLAGLPAAGGSEILSVTGWTYNPWGQPLTQVTTLTGSAATTTSYSYDIMRNLVSTTTQSGGADPRTYAKRYDLRGRLLSELSGDGSAALAALGSNPTQAQIDNLYLQYGWSYTYDTADRLIAKTAPSGTSGVAGAKTLYYYNADNSLAYEVDALGQVTGYVYNAFGERADVILYADTVNLSGMTGGTVLTQVTGSSNLVANATLDSLTHTDFNVDGTVKQATDPLSNVSSFTYNAFGELASSSIALDNDGAGGAARAVLAEKVYDRRGLLKQEKLNSVVVATYDYDAFGRAITLTNALSKSTTSNYDRKGRLTSTVDALGETTTYTYDARDNLVAVKDALNNLTRYVYDKANRKVATIDALGGLTTVSYDGNGRVIAERAYKNIVTISGSVLEIAETNATLVTALANTHADDHVTRYAYDKDGQLRFVVDGLGHVVGYVNDARGNVVRTTAYDGTVNAGLADSSYTEAWLQGQVNAFTSTNHRVTRSVYDATNRLSYSIDAIGQVSWFVYDAKGQLTKTVAFAALYTPTTDPSLANMDSWRATNANATNDRTSRAYYDRKGQLAFSIDALGYVSRVEYDKAGNVKKQTRYADAYSATDATTLANLTTAFASPPSTARTTQFKYDVAGRLEETIDPEGYSTRLVLDVAGQITASTAAYGTADASTTAYVYDDVGRVVKVTRANGATEATATWFFYDAIGQQTAAIDGDNYLAVSTYDAVGNQLTNTRYAKAITGAFTSASTVAQLQTLAGTDATDVATSATYDIFGRLKSTTDGKSSVVSNTYDKTDRLLTVTQEMESGTTDDRITAYTYDNFGGVVKTVDARTNPSFAYYDKLGRVFRQVDGEKYVTDTTYTRGGQIASVKRWANALTGTIIETTVPGNPTADAARDATTAFAYDKRDLLTSTTDAMGFTESYTLNAFGERAQVRNKLHGTVVNGVTLDTTVYYTYDKRGLVLTETLPVDTKNSGGTTISVVNSYRYDARANRIKMVEAGLMDAAGAFVSASSGVEARTTNYSYDKLDRMVQTTGDAVTVVNDDLTSTANVVPTTTIKYDRRGNAIETIDPAGARSLSWYDHMGRVIAQVVQTEKPSGVEKGMLTRTTYDKNGNATETKAFGDLITLPASVTATLPTPVDANNFRLTTYTYDRSNRLLTTSVAGLVTGEWNGSAYAIDTATTVTTSLQYDKTGNVVRQTDGRTNPAYSWYDKLGRQVAQVDAGNYLTVWARDAEGNVTSETRYANKVTGSFTEATDPATLPTLLGTGATDANRVTTFTYDRNGRRLTETRANVANTAINAANGVATNSSAASVITYTYNGLGQVLSKAEASGDTTGYSYDEAGRLVLETGQAFTDYLGSTVTPRTSYTYDGLNNLKATRVQVDASGTNANDRVTSYTYGAGGRLASMTDAAGFTHNYHYDRAGRTVLDDYYRTKSDGSSVTEGQVTRYDLAGRAITQTMARYNGSAWVFTSELAGNPAYDAVRTRYNAYGEITGRGVTAGPAATAVYQEVFEYDAGGRLWRSNTGDGVLRIHIYDKSGNETGVRASTGGDLSWVTLANYGVHFSGLGPAAATYTVYDKRGQATQTIEPGRELTASTTATLTRAKTYNAFGEVLSETNARGHTTSFTYNTMGRMLSKVSPQVSVTGTNGAISSATPTEYYGYDLSGRLVSVTDANGNLMTRALLAGTGHGGGDPLVAKEFHADGGIAQTLHDVFGDARIVRNELYTGSNAVDTDEVQAFDKLGRLTSVQHRGNLLTDNYTYDGLGQRITHTNSQLGGGVVERTDYDAQGRVVKTVAFGGDTTSYAYAWDTSLSTGGLADYDGWVKTLTNAGGVAMAEKTDYFGRVIGSSDFGGTATTLTFDLGGRLVTRAISGGSTTTYDWYNTGLQKGVTTGGAVSSYSYDAGGNRLTETYTVGGVTYQSATATWDAMNRMTAFDDAGVSGGAAVNIDYEYDARGNVIHMVSQYSNLDSQGAVTGTPILQDSWYAYDNMNRFLVTQGQLIQYDGTGTYPLQMGDAARGLSGTAVDRGMSGISIAYDKASRRISAAKTLQDGYATFDPLTFHIFYWEQKEFYTYRADGQLARTDIGSGSQVENPGTVAFVRPPAATSGTQRAVYTRDAMGRVTGYSEYAADGTTVVYSRSATYNAGSQVTWDQTVSHRNDGVFRSDTSYYYNATLSGGQWVGVTSGGTYMGGVVTGTTSVNYKNNNNGDADDTSTFHQFTWGQDATLVYTVHDKNTGSSSNTLWTTNYYRDGSGYLTSAYIADGRPRTVTLVNDAEGRVLQRDEADNLSGGDPRQLHYYFNGRRVGDISNNGTSNVDYVTSITQHQEAPAGTGAFHNGQTTGWSYADFDQSYDAINGLNYDSTASSYTVATGDTLTTIAQNVWGDASLWYLIAEANGLNGTEMLVAGQLLTIPGKVHNIHHSSETWRPYNPNEAQGDLSPTAPKPKKKPPCGGFGMILLMVIAIAVTAVVTAGIGALATGQGFGTAFSAMMAGNLASLGVVGGAAGATLGSAGAIAAGVAGAVAGSVVSQGIGVATGLQERFSWKSVALAGITAAVTAGIGRIGSSGSASSGASNSAQALADAATQTASTQSLVNAANAAATTTSGISNVLKSMATGFLRGAAGNAITQGIGRVTGLQKKFDFLGVALAGIGGGVGAGVTKAFGNVSGSLARAGVGLVAGMAGGVATAAARSIITGSDFGDNILAALPDVIGQTIGNLIVEGVNGEMGKATVRRSSYLSRANDAVGIDQDLILALAMSGSSPLTVEGAAEWFNNVDFWDARRAKYIELLKAGNELEPDLFGLLSDYAIAPGGLKTFGGAQLYPASYSESGPQDWRSAIGGWLDDVGDKITDFTDYLLDTRLPGRETTIREDLNAIVVYGGREGQRVYTNVHRVVGSVVRETFSDENIGRSVVQGIARQTGIPIDLIFTDRDMGAAGRGVKRGVVNTAKGGLATLQTAADLSSPGIIAAVMERAGVRVPGPNANRTLVPTWNAGTQAGTAVVARVVNPSLIGSDISAGAAYAQDRYNAFQRLDPATQTEVLLEHGFQWGTEGAIAVMTGGRTVRLRGPAAAAESLPINTKLALEGVTNRAVADLAANPGLARELMSPGSYRHLVEGTNLAPASYGKAVERLAGRYVRADPELSQILQYQSRPFKSTPDFFGYEGYNLRPLDITTEASRANHLARPYGAYTEYVTHPGLPPKLVFPR